MPTLSLQFVLGASSGELRRGSLETLVRRVCTDSRQARPGDLFIPLVGDRFDGHDFLGEVAARGVTAVLTHRRESADVVGDCAVIAVDDTRRALGRLGAGHRNHFSGAVIGVAGSNGKTTTKGLLASILSVKFRTLVSPASFNNDIGVPLTLLELGPEHEVAVLEAGTNHPGELAPLLAMIRPRYGVLTSLGREHLEFFGGLDGVVDEEGSLAQCLPADGRLFIHADNPLAEAVIRRCEAPVTRIGWKAGNDWVVSGIRVELRGTSFEIKAPRSRHDGSYFVPLPGRHQAVNAALAIAVAAELGLSRDEIQRGLAASAPAKMRLQLSECRGVGILDDTYNANADSARAALETLRDLPCRGRRIAVLGEMSELGNFSEAAHEEVGRCAAETGVDALFAVGRMAGILGAAARAAGLRAVNEFEDIGPAAVALAGTVRAGDLVLFKASRAARLERIVEQLQQGRGATDSAGGTGAASSLKRCQPF